MLKRTIGWLGCGLPRNAAARGGHASEPCARRLASTLLAASVGLLASDASGWWSAPNTGAPQSFVTRDAVTAATPALPGNSEKPSRRGVVGAVVSHGQDDDQPAGACWHASVGGAPPSCLCSAWTVEDLLTPEFLRTLLMAWHDAGSLSAGELHERLQEVDATCGPRDAMP